MTYIIKSNVAMTNKANAVGNIHNYYASQDYRAMLDFSNKIYLVDGIEKELNTLLTNTGRGISSYVDILGNTKLAETQTLRVGLVPEYSESGLLIESASENLLSSSDLSAEFNIPNAKQIVCVSWEGSGKITLNSDNEATYKDTVKYLGRTYDFYDRPAKAFTARITTTGDVVRPSVIVSSYAKSYTPPQVKKDADTVVFNGELKDIIKTGSATVLVRFAQPKTTLGEVTNIYMTAINENGSYGGLFANIAYSQLSQKTATLKTNADGMPSTSAVTSITNIGNKSDIGVIGMGFEDKGKKSALISYGQFGTATNVTGTPSALTNFQIGQPWAATTPYASDMVITHIVVYDRLLSDDELRKVVFFGH